MDLMMHSAKIQHSANGSLQPPSQYSYIPGLLSAKFRGRDQELIWLRDTLTSSVSPHVRRRAGLYGMTGIGKSQIVCFTSLLTQYDVT